MINFFNHLFPMYQKNNIFAACSPNIIFMALVCTAFLFASNTKLKGYLSNGCRAKKPIIVFGDTEKGSLSLLYNFNFLLMPNTVKSPVQAINEHPQTAKALALSLVKETSLSALAHHRHATRAEAKETGSKFVACIAQTFPNLHKLKCKIVSCTGFTTIRARYQNRYLYARAYSLQSAFVRFAEEYYLKVC